jgi:AcrR family transcriptional regulator
MVSTRQRLIQSALELFTTQGINAATTKQIAEAAEVNEVTLFRQFGNKQGLLLAVIEESEPFQNLGLGLIQPIDSADDPYRILWDYASVTLNNCDQISPLLRSLLGESDQYSTATRRALGQHLTTANQQLAQHFSPVIPTLDTSLLNSNLLGYVMTELSLEDHGLWADRADFLHRLVQRCLPDANSSQMATRPLSLTVEDLPDHWVHQILERSRKRSPQETALAYVLFGAGLSPQEITQLNRQQYISDRDQSYLQVKLTSQFRTIPLNQWILGKRYGTYSNNPLTKWLKQRKDDSPALFTLSLGQMEETWQTWVDGLLQADGTILIALQAQQTWCVEMLMRGVTQENLSILTGWTRRQIQPYCDRAGIKLALAQAIALDQKPR